MNAIAPPAPVATPRRLAVALFAAFVVAACGDGNQPTAPDAKSPPVLQAIGSDPTTGATLETDKDDYLPGEVVHLKGSGWAPGETIDLHMTEEPDTHGPVDQTVDADSTGAFSMHFYDVQQHDLGSTFTLTATGRVSGSVATVVFVDAQLDLSIATTPPSIGVTTIAYATGQNNCPVGTTGNSYTVGGTVIQVSNNRFVKFAIPTVAGYTYTGYSWTGPTTVTPTSSSSNTSLCVQGTNAAAVGTLTLNYTSSVISTTTSVAAAPTPSVFGQSVTFTATVTPASGPAATGTVRFYEFTGVQSCTALGGAPELASDNASPFQYVTGALSVGAHTISACFTPNAGWNASGGSTPHTVNKADASVSVSDNPPTSSNAGQSVTFTAALAAVAPGIGTPAGTVKFYEFTSGQSCAALGGATELASDDTAPFAFSTSALLEGAHTISACYGGDANFNGASGSVTHTVSINATTTDLASSPNPSVSGQSVTFTATVEHNGSPVGANGTITFKTGGTSCTDAAPFAAPIALNGSGQAQTTQAFQASGGTVTMRACYSGVTGLYSPSADHVDQAVNKANTSTALTVSPASTTYGDQVTLTAAITVVAPGAGTPTGTVTFYDDLGADNTCAAPNGNSLGSDAVASGQASIQTALIGAGTYDIAACYGGDGNFNASGDTDDLSVAKKTLDVTASSHTKTYGQVVTVTPSYDDFVNGDDASDIDTAPSCSSAGAAATASVFNSPYATTCSGGTDDNYDFSFTPGSITVNPASLTITASSGTKQFGQTYTVTPSYSAFQNGETPATALTPLPSCTSAGSAAGATVGGSPYTTTCSGAVANDGNYAIAYVAGSLTVTAATTTLTLASPATTQYSDKIELSASVAPVSLEGQTQSGSVEFFIGGASVGTATINASGVATKSDIANAYLPANYDVTATFTSTNVNFGNDSDGPRTLTITKEDAAVSAPTTNVGSILFNSTSVALTFNVNERSPEPDPSPDPLGRAQPGDINLVTSLTATMSGVASNQSYTGTCVAGTASGSGYGKTKPFTCTFSSATTGNQFVVDAYTISLTVGSTHYTGTGEDVLSVYDPAAGFVNGGGKFIDADGRRVSFGMSFTYTGKNRTGYRAGWVIVKHFADGSVCRVKSNTLNAPSVLNNTASISGKSNYACVNRYGVTTASQGNVSATGYVEDNGTSGIGQDKFWVSAFGQLLMPAPAKTNAKLLTGGNIQVPLPSSK